MCIRFWKISSETQCFYLRPTTQCTFTECILCSIVCLNVYNVSKNFLWNPLLLPGAHCSVYSHRTHTLFNCMFECVYCFKKFLQKSFACAWSPTLTVLQQSAYFVQLYVWICIMFWKTTSEGHYFCLNPTTQCTFTERILRSIVCLNVYKVLKNFFWKPMLLLEAQCSVNFHRAHTLFNCMFECVYCYKKFLQKNFACAWSPTLTVLQQSAYFVQLYVWIYIMFWKISSGSHCFCLKPTTQCTSTESIFCSVVCLNVYIDLKKFFRKALLVLEAHYSLYFNWVHILFNCMFEYVSCFEKLLLKAITSAWSPPLSDKLTERKLCSIVCLNVYKVLKNFFWNPMLLLEAHHSVYFHRMHTLFNCMFEGV